MGFLQVGASGCHHMGGNQLYKLNTEGQLTSGEWCTDYTGTALQVQWCKVGSTDGPWKYLDDTKQLYHQKHQQCLGLSPDNQRPIVRKCDSNNLYQKWEFKEISPYWKRS